MATMRYVRSRRRWLVRWHVTVKQGPQADQIVAGSKTFIGKQAAQTFRDHIRDREQFWAAGLSCDIRITQTLESYTQHLQQYTPQTRRLYSDAVAFFLEALPTPVTVISQIKRSHIETWLADIQQGRSMRTVNNSLDGIRNYCKFLADRFET